jgi:small conductance mechanosensitive channel
MIGGDINWAGLGPWLLSQGIWVLLGVVVLAALYIFFLHNFMPRLVQRGIEGIGSERLRKALSKRAKGISFVLSSIAALFLAIPTALILLAFMGINVRPAVSVFGNAGATIGNWLVSHGLRIAIVLFLGYLARAVTHALVPELVALWLAATQTQRTEGEVRKRLETLTGVLQTAITTVILGAVGFMILSELGIDITPILAGAGIAGIALGFGAQSLVKDVIGGIFILAEDQYGVGDVVRVADVAGLVEDINLRRTILRDLDGIVHSIPNGEIRVASNFTRDWSRVNINIPVAYGEDLDHVIAVLNRVGQELAEDPDFGPLITKAPQVLRVDNFGDSSIDIKMLGETLPIRQWDVMGELRKRVKKAFDEEGIEIPWPHVKLYFGDLPTELQKMLVSLDRGSPAKAKREGSTNQEVAGGQGG